MLKTITNLLVSLLFVATSYGETPWSKTVQSYTELRNKSYQWDETYSDNLNLTDVLRALPSPEQWTALRADYAASLPDQATKKNEGTLTQLLLSYLDGDTQATEQHLETLEATLEEDEDNNRNLIYDLRRNLYKANEEIAPEKRIEQFKIELQQYQPVTTDVLVEILESTETIEHIEIYLNAQQDIMHEYMKLFQEGMPEDGESMVLALQEKAMKLEADHPVAAEALETHQDNPILQAYLQTRLNPMSNAYVPSIQVPDLVTLAGEERARELLIDALSSNVQLSIDNADATLRLARELALKHHEDLAVPQWSLVNSIDQVELYELMSAQFPTQDGVELGYQLKRASGYYFWGLVAAARTDDAMLLIENTPGLVENMPYDAIRNLKKAGYARAIWKFLDQILSAHPSLDLWDDYMALSAELDESAHMLETVKSAIAADSLSSDLAIQKQVILASAYLSANDINEGVRWLDQALQTTAQSTEGAKAQFEAAERLTKLGQLLGKAEWLETGLAGAKTDGIDFISEYGSVEAYLYLDLVRLHQNIGQNTQAEILLEELMERIEKEGQALVKKTNEKAKDTEDYYSANGAESIEAFRKSNRSDYQKILVAKVGLLVAKQDYAAAQAVLDEEKLWLAGDVAELISESDTSPQARPFGWLVAKTLHEQGESDQAADVLEALLRKQNGYDPAYALYLEIKGDAAIEYFDKLYAIDQFQERPLIWKAQHLVNRDKIEAAEAIATQAIAIDPSDGEQPKNDRMRVYDVMRQIRSAQGNTKEAVFFADVLKAIRASENADDYYSLGLHTLAIEHYLKSLEFFQDAYCIQSRVAVRLYDEGRVDEAVVHYKKAYELMPSSFGRVESHCFGCESVFKGDKPQSIAEEVFSGLLVTQPDTPQVHYLMGYLRDYQEREVEALKHLRDAVGLDPDYLNAWKKIASLSHQMSFSNQERDELTLKIYSLDPVGQHSSPNLGEIKNIKTMWQAVQANQKLLQLVPKRDQVYPLTAAQKLAEALKEDDNRYNYNREIEHPVDALKSNPVIEEIEGLFIELSQEETM